MWVHFFAGCMVFSPVVAMRPDPLLSDQVVKIYTKQFDLVVEYNDCNSLLTTTPVDELYNRHLEAHVFIQDSTKKSVLVRRRQVGYPSINAALLTAIAERGLACARCRHVPKNAE